MAAHDKPRRQPSGKSKTDLRRGKFTPGYPSGKKSTMPRGGGGATIEEQVMLFDEELGKET